jgi:DNA-binding transcriptional LysR family regulator
MDFDQLEIFLEVARLSSFSRAAEKRFRTQPAVSSQIRVLEEEVGARLLDRSGGRVSLTASGKLFSKYAEETLDRRKTILTEIAETERVPRGEIVVGANEGTCLHILPEVFAQFKRDYPNVAVSIKRSDYGRILESILENVVDFGVVSLPVNDNRLEAQMIHRDELVVITAPGHALAAKSSVTLAEVSAYPLVMPKLGHTRDALDALFYDHHLKPNLAMELDSSELLKRFVAAGVGVGFIARSNIEEDIRAKALVAITLADAQIRRDLALVFRKDKSLSRAAKAFMEIAVKQRNFSTSVTGAGKRSR